MKKNSKLQKAFTLVEMIVSVTISIILLASISLFMWNGIKNITFQKNTLEALQKNSQIYSTIFQKISGSSDFKSISSSWFLIKIDKKYDKWGFAYIWEKTFNKAYCQTGNLDTNHLIIKTFVPFEYPWADFLDWTSYIWWWITTKFFDWKVVWTSWKFVWPSDYLKDSNWKIYISDTADNTIKDKNWNIIIWKSWIFWNYFKQGIDAKKVLLNNPTWLAYWEWKLFFSDTLNDRILYLDSWKIYKLLDESDWLNEPTGLFYDDFRKSLFIANSWSWNILEFSSSWVTNNPNLKINWINASSISKLEIEFLNSSGTWAWINLSWPTSTWSFHFSNWWEDFVSFSWSKLIYEFEEYSNPETSQSDCDSAPKYIVNSSKEHVKCTQTWTWIVASTRSVSFNNLEVSDILPNFPKDNYFVKLELFDSSWNSKYKKYFPYFTKSDSLVSTKDDNNLREVIWNLAYPTWIKVSWNYLIVNSFLDRKKYKININNWTKTDNWDLNWFNNLQNLVINKKSDYISDFPIKKLDFWKNWNLLSIILKTYKKYSCLDNSENIEDVEVIKKKIN